ncbi:hypothetical protein L1987_34995 [Smallanthus sonchifolius]|uniref:Uncharacterized protein n=1 Tax=Smallanthus sonchifolius TaxID=185202 RepID=A0ACB9HWL4_9ASTR|nr:hypothetical protein L1987_34995 [Smallanthus sonchifolius]
MVEITVFSVLAMPVLDSVDEEDMLKVFGSSIFTLQRLHRPLLLQIRRRTGNPLRHLIEHLARSRIDDTHEKSLGPPVGFNEQEEDKSKFTFGFQFI